MKISYNWLKDYIALKVDAQQLAHRLTMAGLEVEKVHPLGNDTVLELEITPNRPDCLNHIGIAREASAIFNLPIKLPKAPALKLPKKKTNITITDKNDCARYSGTVVENISIQETSGWIKKCLEALGLRSVNNVVDITNFVLLETGQPLHAFDFDKLAGGKILVRRAKEGETIVTIDGVERKLNPSVLVIADEKKPVAIAGIMGGKDTEVTQKTKNILLESAYFDSVLIRRAGRTLGLSSDSSYRFERGVDINGVLKGVERALSLILKEAKGNITAATDLYPKKIISSRKLCVPAQNIERLLGILIAPARCQKLLAQLGFKVKAKGNNLFLDIPSFRGDIKQDVDIIEEIARIVGYDSMPMTLPFIKASVIPENPHYLLRETIADTLCAQGLDEVISYTMIPEENLSKSNIRFSDILKVKNPLTSEQGLMRPSLLPGLLSLVAQNANKGQRNVKLFEIGNTYFSSEPTEKETVGMILSGRRRLDGREDKGPVDFYDIKGTLQSILNMALRPETDFVLTNETFLEEGQSAACFLKGKKIGVLGAVSPSILSRWDIKQKHVFYAELDLEALYPLIKPLKPYQPLSEFPSIVRDVSLAVKKNVSFKDIRDLALESRLDFLSDVNFVEQYLGEKIPSGCHGMTLSLIYQSPTRTLREEEINTTHTRFLTSVTQKFNAVIR